MDPTWTAAAAAAAAAVHAAPSARAPCTAPEARKRPAAVTVAAWAAMVLIQSAGEAGPGYFRALVAAMEATAAATRGPAAAGPYAVL